MRLCALLLITATFASAGQPQPPLLPLGRSLLHAHNCYPEKGKWADRLDRALGTGVSPIVIEQDVALATRDGKPVAVVSHDDTLTGTEPTLEDHFFARVQPMLDRALASPAPQQWPLVVLHLDFKTNETAHHRAVWDLLKRHERWLTTAPRVSDTVAPVTRGPLLVLTENGADQEKDFTDARNGDRLLLFGSAPAPAASRIEDSDQRMRALAAASPEALITGPATNYRRWVNFSWQVVENGGQPRAADWSSADTARLKAIVDRAHRLGYHVRFYTLNGHAPNEHPEWTASYNFGSFDAVRQRWRAAIAAGVDLVATDQYEEFAALLKAAATPAR
jgi:glycerophosphoryl diester phosphodiesterase